MVHPLYPEGKGAWGSGGAFFNGKEGRVDFRKNLRFKGGLVGFRKTSLNAKEVFRKPTSTFLTFEKNKSNWVFRKPTSPPLPLREGPPLFPSPFPLRGQGMCQPPYSVLKPLRYKVGGPSEVYASSGAAVFCAGMNPLSLKDLLKGCLLVAFIENHQSSLEP